MIEQVLEEAKSLHVIVDIINTSGCQSELSGQYAWSAADNQEDTSADNIEAHLEILQEAGAKFKHEEAIEESERLIIVKKLANLGL